MGGAIVLLRAKPAKKRPVRGAHEKKEAAVRREKNGAGAACKKVATGLPSPRKTQNIGRTQKLRLLDIFSFCLFLRRDLFVNNKNLVDKDKISQEFWYVKNILTRFLLK